MFCVIINARETFKAKICINRMMIHHIKRHWVTHICTGYKALIHHCSSGHEGMALQRMRDVCSSGHEAWPYRGCVTCAAAGTRHGPTAHS